MRQAKDYAYGDPVYIFVAADGTNIHIDARRLREWTLKAKPPVYMTPVDAGLAKQFLRENIVSRQRVEELWHRQDLTPIIYCMDGQITNGRPDVMLVDGHHRYVLRAVKAWQAGSTAPLIEAHILAPVHWQNFQITGLQDLTQAQLREAPLGRRDY